MTLVYEPTAMLVSICALTVAAVRSLRFLLTWDGV